MIKKYLNLFFPGNEGFKRLFIILHFSFFSFLTYWFFDNYQPSDFGLIGLHDYTDNHWNTFADNSYFSPQWFLSCIKCLLVSLIILMFTFGTPLLLFGIYKFSKLLGIKNKQAQLYFLAIISIIFLLLFWLIWYQMKIIPFERVEFDSYSEIVSLNADSYPKNNYFMTHRSNSDQYTAIWYRNNYNSKFIYDLLLIFIPFLISFVLNSVIVKLFLWVNPTLDEKTETLTVENLENLKININELVIRNLLDSNEGNEKINLINEKINLINKKIKLQIDYDTAKLNLNLLKNGGILNENEYNIKLGALDEELNKLLSEHTHTVKDNIKTPQEVEETNKNQIVLRKTTDGRTLSIHSSIIVGYTIGDLVTIDDKPAPDGRYKMGFMDNLIIENGKLKSL